MVVSGDLSAVHRLRTNVRIGMVVPVSSWPVQRGRMFCVR